MIDSARSTRWAFCLSQAATRSVAGFPGSVLASTEDVIARRGEPEFEAALRIWQRVIETLGSTILAAGFLDAKELAATPDAYTRWGREDAQGQHMVLRAVEGRA